jgi:hypothetical protein
MGLRETLNRMLGPARAGLLALRPAIPVPAWGNEVPRHEGMPVVRLAGSARARGERLGRLVGPQIEFLLRTYLQPFVGHGPARISFERVAGRLAEAMRPEEHAELEGVAAGAGVSLETMRLGTAFLDAHKVALCSTVVVPDRRTGRPLFGRNLDFVSFGVADRLGLVLVHEPEAGIPFVSVGWPGLLGVLSGLNREGLAIALNLVYGEEDADEGVPLTLALQRVLTEATTLEEADRRIRETPFASCNNVTVCDAGGRAAVYEVGPGRLDRRDLAADPLLATNHLASCRVLPDGTPMSVSSHGRYRLLRGMRGSIRRRASLGEVRRALRRVAVPWINLQSMIFDPARRELWLSMGRVPAARGTFVRFPASSLWRS